MFNYCLQLSQRADTGCAIKRGRNALLVLSFGKALVSPESRLKQKQPASSGEDTRLAVDFHLMIPCRIYQILPNRMAVIARVQYLMWL